MKAGYGRERLLRRKTRLTAARYSSTFLVLAHDLVNGSGIGEGALGVEPPPFMRKTALAANLVRIGCEQRVVKRCSSAAVAAGPPATMRASAGSGGRVPTLRGAFRDRPHQLIHVLKIKDVTVVGHGNGARSSVSP